MKNSKAELIHHARIEEDMKGLDTKLLSFEDYVEMGKGLMSRIEVYQARIAFYACRVCQIRHGGKSDKYYTITDYADAIGLNRKSVQQWTLTYRNVINKLDIPLDKITKEVWRTANRVNDNINWRNRSDNKDKGTNRKAVKYKSEIPVHQVQKMFEEESGQEPSFSSEVRLWTCSVRNIKNSIQKRNLTLAHDGNLMELMQMCDFISDHINDHLTKKKRQK